MQPAGKDTKEENKRVVRDGTGRDVPGQAEAGPLTAAQSHSSLHQQCPVLVRQQGKVLRQDKDETSAAGLDKETHQAERTARQQLKKCIWMKTGWMAIQDVIHPEWLQLAVPTVRTRPG